MVKETEPMQNDNSGNQSDRARDTKGVISDSAERWLARNRSLVLRQTPVWAQSLATIMISLGVAATMAGILFRIDEVVTVTGQLESLEGSVDVKTPAGGKVASVHFKDGQLVKEGQLLVRFDTQEANANLTTYEKLIELEISELETKLNILNSRESVLEKKVDTSTQITNELYELVKIGGFQKVQYLRQLDQLYELESELSKVQLDKNQSKLEAEKSIGQYKNKLKQAELQLQYQNVLAPASGIIFEPKARVSGVIAAGDTIVTIIPQKGLRGKVFVQNKDIGFVKTGQKAQVRIDAFPFTQYGEIKADVSQIGADALPPDQKANFYRYPVKLEIEKPYLEREGIKVPLRSGMAITANMKLRDKRLISLISDMFVDQTESIRSIRQQ
ncbi:HlyD family secretion protein [Synechococcus sp. UW86]|uniref:HlyD family secretion protein n=1 Tax=Synechococcus sp. UW86 TaxID=368491 RepID=UPI001483180A|nr:HlyD family efflux transporter periplasmic adaptor subunit [Synechococcus sp. UW86]